MRSIWINLGPIGLVNEYKYPVHKKKVFGRKCNTRDLSEHITHMDIKSFVYHSGFDNNGCLMLLSTNFIFIGRDKWSTSRKYRLQTIPIGSYDILSWGGGHIGFTTNLKLVSFIHDQTMSLNCSVVSDKKILKYISA
jgi:hypothetical protein